jgi:hypothetical protein
MKGSVWRALLIACVGALAFAGVAFAANSGSFLDPTADAGSAPDVNSVTMSNDDSGLVTIKVALANRPSFALTDGIGIGIDADQNPDSGSVIYGAEYELDLEAGAAKLYRASSDGFFEQVPAPASFQAGFSGGTVTITFKPSDLGINSGFNLYTIGFDASAVDAAPDIRTVNYQLAAGTAAPALVPDHRAPLAHAFRARGTHGKLVELDYAALDGRGETQDTIVISKAKHVLKRLSSTLGDTNPFFIYFATWKVPKKVRGALKFCVTSTDRAGNKSPQSCATLTVK